MTTRRKDSNTTNTFSLPSISLLRALSLDFHLTEPYGQTRQAPRKSKIFSLKCSIHSALRLISSCDIKIHKQTSGISYERHESSPTFSLAALAGPFEHLGRHFAFTIYTAGHVCTFREVIFKPVVLPIRHLYIHNPSGIYLRASLLLLSSVMNETTAQLPGTFSTLTALFPQPPQKPPLRALTGVCTSTLGFSFPKSPIIFALLSIIG